MYSGFGLSGSDTESEPPTPPAYPQVSQSHLSSPCDSLTISLHFQLSGNRYIVSFSLGTKFCFISFLHFPTAGQHGCYTIIYYIALPDHKHAHWTFAPSFSLLFMITYYMIATIFDALLPYSICTLFLSHQVYRSCCCM